MTMLCVSSVSPIIRIAISALPGTIKPTFPFHSFLCLKLKNFVTEERTSAGSMVHFLLKILIPAIMVIFQYIFSTSL